MVAKHAESDELQKLISHILEKSRIGRELNGIDIETSGIDDEGDFIRVIVHMKNINELRDDDFDILTSSIESAVTDRDDRFPSVRFTDS